MTLTVHAPRAWIFATAFALPTVAALPAAAQDYEFSLYSGVQSSPHSRIEGELPNGDSFDELIGWEGRSFEMPPYYGLRGTYWRTDRLGFGVEFTHSKVYAPDDEAEDAGFDNFELTDGVNVLTANTMYRWPDNFRALTPYVGGGLGVAVPHVDADPSDGDSTYEYQFGGPALRLMAGASYDLTDRLAVFGEYQFTYSTMDLDLEDGGDVETDIKTNAVNVGLTLKF
ncbi:hypothetical protein ROJ8625_00500 [Roseivivax jejudonensis]|uniref:Outer membrane protein beta-barrel domain-containing protein n=1 Tax=Roseivivax jejudonensis TaxID=1529041 RepID=A0A1X6YAX9_9RHOB|nr:outer membrane beta-barrel protein [Roseivivax jejudonensis]SLN15531.1 hypothetical protein ROJ8625_00500 [Roseivivax jejudonensis]